MNEKITALARDIGHFISNYNKEYIEELFYDSPILITDVIFQILFECCRYSFLINLETKPLKYYVERDGFEYELEKKNFQRTIKKINLYFDASTAMEEKNLGSSFSRPEIKLEKNESNRFPSYSLSEYQYWESYNIHNMPLVYAIVNRRIGTSKKISDAEFKKIIKNYDSCVEGYIKEAEKSPEQNILSFIKLYTLEAKYSFEFLYAIATEMEESHIDTIPNMKQRLMASCGSYKYASILPELNPQLASEQDCMVQYPMVFARNRFIRQIISEPESSAIDYFLSKLNEANVLANSVQSHMLLDGLPMRQWFAENVSVDDCMSVFNHINIFDQYISNKQWTNLKIKKIRKFYQELSLDYKNLNIPKTAPIE